MKQFRAEIGKETREFFLIICEGKKTEPNYFEGYKKELPKFVINLEICGGCGNTRSLICHAETRNATRKRVYGVGYDQIWLVFDKDDFPPSRFNDTILMAESHGWKCAYSNEAFELWYLLHFEYCNTGISRQQYFKKLEKYIGTYEKNDPNIYDRLKELNTQKRAIRWANKLYNLYDHRQIANEKPSTTVHKLVEELNKFIL